LLPKTPKPLKLIIKTYCQWSHQRTSFKSLSLRSQKEKA